MFCFEILFCSFLSPASQSHQDGGDEEDGMDAADGEDDAEEPMDDADDGEEEGEFKNDAETHDPNSWSNFSGVVKSGKVLINLLFSCNMVTICCMYLTNLLFLVACCSTC